MPRLVDIFTGFGNISEIYGDKFPVLKELPLSFGMEIKISEYRVSELWVSEGVTGLRHNSKLETGAFVTEAWLHISILLDRLVICSYLNEYRNSIGLLRKPLCKQTHRISCFLLCTTDHATIFLT